MEISPNTLIIRSEEPGDHDDITHVNDLAFKQKEEGVLIQKLRADPQFDGRLSLVAVLDGEIVGYILFFPVAIENGDMFHDTISLAPMAVLPAYQRNGIGLELIMRGLAKLGKLGYESVIVLGDPEYYPKFGFQPASKWNIKAPFECPDESFMALELMKGSLDDKSGQVFYPDPFFDAL